MSCAAAAPSCMMTRATAPRRSSEGRPLSTRGRGASPTCSSPWCRRSARAKEEAVAMKLYGFWRSLATYRVRAVLALKGIAVEQVSINLLEGKQHSAEYKALNPQSVVPALVLDGGALLFQSMAILEYLEE